MSENILFVCDSYYHVLCSVSRTINEKLNADIYITHNINNYQQLVKRLHYVQIFSHIYIVKENNNYKFSPKIDFKLKLFQYWAYAKQLKNNLKHLFPANLLKYKIIYIYNEWNLIPKYLKLSRKSFVTCEDACGYYQIFNNRPFVYDKLLKENNRFRDRLIKTIKREILYGPYCRFVKSMLVTSKKNMFIPSKIKIKEFDFQGSIKKCINNNPKMINYIFNNKLHFQSNKKIMIVCTSIYYHEGHLTGVELEKKQHAIINKIIFLYKSRYLIYIKPHPNDTVDYSSIKGVVILDKNIPLELIKYTDLNKIDKFFGVYTTSLNFLPKNKLIYYKTPSDFLDKP